MSLLRNAIRSSFALRLRCANGSRRASSSLLLRESPRSFSTGAEQPPQAPVAEERPAQDFTAGSSFPQRSPGLVYGRLIGISRSTLKTDIISLLDGCNLSPNDVKVDYNPDAEFLPLGMLIRFASRRAYDQATMMINRSGRLHRLEGIDRRLWDNHKSYDGKTVIINGMPQTAGPDDLDRFLSGCEYGDSSVQVLSRRQVTKTVLVKFPSQAQAMNAVITKNGGFVLNSQVSLHVLQ